MTLPIISTPKFTTDVPSTGETVHFRPFLVKEEKILLMAMEGGDANEMTEATKTILQNCIEEDIDINKLATFDVEYLFLKLRAKSVGEMIELRIGHTGDTSCEHKTEVSINIDDIKVEGVDTNNKIMVTDTVGIVVHYPSMMDVAHLDIDDKDTPFKIIASCIEMVFDGDNVYEEFSEQEMIQWLEGLSQSQFAKVSEFFSKMPKLSHKIEWKCEKCKKKDSFVIEGLASFFTLL